MTIYRNTYRRCESPLRSRPRRALLLAIASLVGSALFLGSAMPAFSGDSATVNASVSVSQAVCLTLDKTSLDFGTAGFDRRDALVALEGNIVVTNCGGAGEKLFARGTDATNANASVGWTLLDQSSPGFNDLFACGGGAVTNKYSLAIRGADNSWGQYLSKTDQQILIGTSGSLIPAGDGVTIDSRMRMPCPGSDGAGQAMSWQYVYTATL